MISMIPSQTQSQSQTQTATPLTRTSNNTTPPTQSPTTEKAPEKAPEEFEWITNTKCLFVFLASIVLLIITIVLVDADVPMPAIIVLSVLCGVCGVISVGMGIILYNGGWQNTSADRTKYINSRNKS
jgi:hypothetical protein